IMREFTIDELSGVDRPAQEGARVCFFKRDDSEQEEPASFESFEAAVEHLRKIHGSGTAAMSAARAQFPDLLRKYRQAGDEAAAKAAGAAAPREVAKAVSDWYALVDKIAERDGVSRTVAMSRARKEFPHAFRDFQNS